MADLAQARAVKLQIAERLRAVPEVNGIGLVRNTGGWAVKVNLLRSAPGLMLPAEIDGVAIAVDIIGPIVTQ
jgi:hypothetical protein